MLNVQLSLFDRACELCGAPFSGRSDRRFCSKRCVNRCFAVRRERPNRNEEQRRQRAARRVRGEKYNPWTDAMRAAYHRRRAKTHGVARVEKFSHLEVFERDGWRCGICGEAVDGGLAYPDRRSASLDHIIPIARGGQHERSNVQLAHLVCNQWKHARLPEEVTTDGRYGTPAEAS